MSTPHPSEDGPTTEREFDDKLGSLLERARRNGVDVEGGWDFRSDRDEIPDWGVEIYEVTKPRRAVDVG